MTSVPLLCLPIGFGLIFLPKVPLSLAMAREPGGYNNVAPRDQQAKLSGWGRRAAAAHANGFESFPAFAAGVLATQITGASPQVAALFSIVYVVSRAFYTLAYLAGMASLRSMLWLVGTGASVGLMILPLVS